MLSLSVDREPAAMVTTHMADGRAVTGATQVLGAQLVVGVRQYLLEPHSPE